MWPLKRSTIPLICGWRGGITRCSIPNSLQTKSNSCFPVDDFVAPADRSVNWLPLSVRMVLIFIGAARFNRRRKSELLLLDWSL